MGVGEALRAGLETVASQTSFNQFSSCSQSWSLYNAQTAMTLTLTLSEGGKAQSCREKRAEQTDVDGMWRTEDRLGMVGTWKRDGDSITLRLRALLHPY